MADDDANAITWFQTVTSAVTALPIVCNFFKPVSEALSRIEKKHSDLVTNLKTLRATRDDLKSRATKKTSAKEKTMDDWFHRVEDVEKRAQELENKIEEKQGTVNVYTRTKLNRRMAKMILEISELDTKGNELWGYFDEK